MDSLQANMPYFSPYLFSNDSPIIFRDLDGKVGTLYIQILKNDKGKPVLSKAVVENLVNDISKMYNELNIYLKVESNFSNEII